LTRAGKRKMGPGERIRALVVDDSVIIRRLVAHALEEDRDVAVVGSAANGVIALRMIPLLKPDVVTLDIEMPEMDGLETLRQIRKLYPDLIVIMFSTLSERGAAITIEALSLGANDYVTKVANSGSLDESMAKLRGELVPRFKQFFSLASDPAGLVAPKPLPAARPIAAAPAVLTRQIKACEAVAIGVSTGGPNALAQLVPMLPADFRQPIFIVQHMPPIFTRLLAERLQSLTKLRVREAADDMLVEEGNIYIAPGDYHMKVARKGTAHIIKLDREEPENSCRPAVDVLFRSVAEVYGGSAMGVILTGMGQDGLLGIKRLRAAGSYIVAQDEASSVVWGMPGAVVNAGLADSVVDLRCVVAEIRRHL
jgi:two-component system, chemotaxis family, protein-glutamate methylesterase/glutaminase